MSAPERPRREWRTVDGILLLDKPEGLSSNHALQQARRVYRARKAGHTGSLDPLASGVLPICFGQATKIAGLLLEADKTYRATLALGAQTATGDREGEVITTAPVPPLDRACVEAAFVHFIGATSQVPPMYSALKQGGQTLYALARRGITVERTSREVHIEALRLLELSETTLQFEVTCSKGTYVRTLGEDLARQLGTVGHLAALRRTLVGGPLAAATPVTLETLEALAGDEPALDRLLLPADAAVTGLPAVTLAPESAARVGHGQRVDIAAGTPGRVRLYGSAGVFLGIGEVSGDGCTVRPIRLMPPAEPQPAR